MILDRINSPKDLKELSLTEMQDLAQEMRKLIIKKVNITGGHMAPNLGIVEMTIALHYVFNMPQDKLVFDVSHQCYPHKMLTGRKEGFLKEENYYKYTGFTAPEESEFDIFKVGHTSTAASLACGLAKARDLKGENHNVIALIGDGSATGGQAFEGLDNAATLNSNIIMIINDNEMSIAQNYGGLYDNLNLLRETKGEASLNFFKTMGYEYLYLEEGNDIEKLIELFKKVKDTTKPIVLHIHTLKGKGLKQAEDNKEKFHWILPHTLDTVDNSDIKTQETYINLAKDFILKKVKADKTVVAINAGTPGVFGLDENFRNTLKQQYVDVGICEEHAIAFSSALAKAGCKPFFFVMSSFLQRTYDQLSQDLCLNNSPVKILVYNAFLSGEDATHVGAFDISLISNIPNMIYLAPTNKEEYLAMLEYAYKEHEHPIAIRVPVTELESTGIEDKTDYSILNKFKITNKGEKIAILGLGNFYKLAQDLKEKLEKELNINATLINPKFITGLDTDLLNKLKENHSLVISLEDGILDGGFGEKIARFYGSSDVKVLCFGGKKEFTDRIAIHKTYEKNHLTTELIIKDIKEICNI